MRDGRGRPRRRACGPAWRCPSARASQAAASPGSSPCRETARSRLLPGLIGAERPVQHHTPAQFLIKVLQAGDRWSRPVGGKQVPEALELANHQQRPERLVLSSTSRPTSLASSRARSSISTACEDELAERHARSTGRNVRTRLLPGPCELAERFGRPRLPALPHRTG